MVIPIEGARTGITIAERLPLVVELVGPAGAGKSTLARLLVQSDEKALLGDPPFVWSVADLPFFVRYGLPLVPMLLHLCRNRDGRRPTRREIAWMMILNGWHRVVHHRVTKNARVVVLDQGPVFMLAQLQAFGPERLRSSNAAHWWEAIYGQWAAALDAVVYLDAPDGCLLQRIRTRAKWHIVKEESPSAVYHFLARYRKAYGEVIALLTGNSRDLKVLTFDTAREPLDVVVGSLLLEFGLGRSST